MGGFVLVSGKRQTVKINADTLQEIAQILGIVRSDEVTAVSVAISLRPPAAAPAARSRRRGRARPSTGRGRK
jgi:hypothetical protein